jgi:hypothetical protein
MISNNNTSFYINHLNLVPHPEGGWYRETYRSDEIIRHESLPARFAGDRCFSTAIYFLLEEGNFSAFHRIKSDELWHFYAGDTLEIILIAENGELCITNLGSNPEKGETFQYAVPDVYWMATRLKGNGKFALAGCTVAPGFDFADFEMAERTQLIKLFPQHENIIIKLTRS